MSLKPQFFLFALCVAVTTAFAQPYSDALFSCTYLGGMFDDGSSYQNTRLAEGPDGSIYITGSTESFDFPFVTGAYDSLHTGGLDVFVCKFSHDLTELQAATFLGHANDEEPGGILVDDEGNVYVAGNTKSPDFPVHETAYDTSYNGTSPTAPYEAGGDVFVSKFDPDLTTLLGSTFIGGSSHEWARGMCFDDAGNIVITGATASGNFPADANAFQPDHNPGGYYADDCYVAIIDPQLENLIACTYLGGNQLDFSECVMVSEGIIYCAGWAGSPDFPVSVNAYQTGFHYGYYDGFITGLTADLTDMTASTFIGGTNWDFNYGMTADDEGNLYVTGHTASSNFPFTTGAFDTVYTGSTTGGVGDDAFISKFPPELDILLASTFLGGNYWEIGTQMVFDGEGDLFVSGYTNSTTFPFTFGAFAENSGGGYDAFISKFEPDLTDITASTYFGGAGHDYGYAMILDGPGNVFFGGRTASQNNFPVFNWGYSGNYCGGEYDSFIARLDNDISAGMSGITSPEPGDDFRLETPILHSPCPNPFNDSVVLRYEISRESRVSLSIFDINGRKIGSLADSRKPAGIYSVQFNSDHLATGIYLARLETENCLQIQKLLHIK